MSTQFSITLLGSFAVTVDDQPVAVPASGQRLIALLALERRPVARSHAAGLLWPDKTEDRAAANLRSTLWRLNGRVQGLIDCDGSTLTIADGVVVDTDRFLPTVDGDETSPYISATTASIVARPPINVELLVDWYDEWVIVERERLRQLTLRALENAAVELRRLGLFAEAVDAGSVAVRLAPLRESAHRAVIETHLAEGNYAEAVRQYETCSALIFEAFGVLPSDSLRALFHHFGSEIQASERRDSSF